MQKKRTTWLIGLSLMMGFMSGTIVAVAQDSTETPTIELFMGKDLNGWLARNPDVKNEWLLAKNVTLSKKDTKKFKIQSGEGVMVNGPKGNTTDIYSQAEFGDCQLHIEFVVPKGSNSGVYLQGLYEIQVYDSFEKEDRELTFTDCGGIYARYDEKTDKTYEGEAPKVNASKSPGEWQSFDAIFRAPRFDDQGNKTENAKFLLVKHNGVVVHENYEVTGGTRACMDRPESPKGPLLLQGDHGPVAYRNITLIPLQLK